MENLDFVGNINGIWGFLGLALMLLSRWIITAKTSKTRTKNNYKHLLKELEKKFDNSKSDIDDLKAELSSLKTDFIGHQVTDLILNKSNKTWLIEKLYKEYDSRGGNHYVSELYDEWNKAKERPRDLSGKFKAING